MVTAEIPELVEDGYERRVDHGHGVETLWYPDGGVGVLHVCDRSIRPQDGRTIKIAPFLQLREGGGHTIVSTDPVTISPSVGCSDCGLHGFITNGRWEPC